MKIIITFTIRCKEPGSREPLKFRDAYWDANVTPKVFKRLTRFSGIAEIDGDSINFDEVDITRPEVAEAMQILYDNGWYPGDGIRPHSKKFNWYREPLEIGDSGEGVAGTSKQLLRYPLAGRKSHVQRPL